MKDTAAATNRYNLSASQDWQALLSHFELGEGFAFIVLLVEDEQGAEACHGALGRFLQGHGKELMELPVTESLELKQMAGPLLKLEDGLTVGALWVARVVPEGYQDYAGWREAWREGVARLNQFRNPLRRKWSVPVIFVGAPWLQEVLREHAPDLWSVRTLVAWVEPEKTVTGADLRPMSEAARPSYRPDPELAIAEANRLRSQGGSDLAVARLLYRAGLGFVAQYRWEEAKQAFSEALAIRRRAGAPAEDQADAAFQLGKVLTWTLDYPAARELFEQALGTYRSLGSVQGAANCIKNLGDIALRRSDHAEARRQYEEALPLYRQVGDVLGEANCIQGLGDIAFQRSNQEEAHRRYEEARLLFRQVGSQVGEANCTRGLGDIALGRSDYAEARRRYEEALSLFRQVGSVQGITNCLRSLADIAFRRSDYDESRRLYEVAAGLYRQVADLLGEASCIARLGEIALARSDQGEAQKRFQEALPLVRQVGSVRGEANCLLGLGYVALQRSDYPEARRRDEEALRLYRQIGDSLGEANSIQSLGDIARARADNAEARRRYEEALELYRHLGDPYAIGRAHHRLACTIEDLEERAVHVQAAREAWLAIDRPDLVQQLDNEFAPSLPKDVGQT